MIRALDSRLVAAAQWAVDLTQRQPHTLGGLSVALSAVPPLCAAAGAACSASQTGYGLSLLQSLASLACWCFATCRPPRPRAPRPRGRLALGGAA